MLVVDDLSVRYAAAAAVSGVTFRVDAGEVVAVLGRNGAGKSTTLKAVMGLVPISSGRAVLSGRDLADLRPQERCELGVGWVPEDRRIFRGLTVRENLIVGRRSPRPGVPTWTEAEVFRLFPALAELGDRRGGALSGGEQQMLTIARTLMGNPSLLLLDEPSTGLAPLIAEQLYAALGDLKHQGLTILLAEQTLRYACKLSDRAVVLESGCVRWTGGMADFAADDEAKRAFLAV